MKGLLIYRTVLVLFILWLLYAILWASFQQSLFAEFARLWAEPWMKVTLLDFYLGIFLFTSWVAYRERSVIKTAIWLVAFVFLGNLATLAYVFLILGRVKDFNELPTVLLNRPSSS